MASIILDDTTDRLTRGGVKWVNFFDPGKFGGGDTWANVTTPTKFGTLSISFHGTSIAFSGWVGAPDGSPTFLVSIDNSPPSESTYQVGSIDTHQWYQTPLLSDTPHVLNISRFPENVDVDYMVVTAGQNTPLLGEQLIVDDADASIVYNGTWSYRDDSYEISFDNDTETAYPHGNGTHRTTTPGSDATFHFQGTSVSVYGVFNWNAPCNMSVKYTVDDVPTTKTYTVVGSKFYKERIHNVGHTLLFEAPPLAAGQHTLNMELMEIGPNADSNEFAFALDYILYTPSFKSLAELGSLNPTTQVITVGPASTTPPGVSNTPGVSPVPLPGKGDHAKLAGVAGGLSAALIILLLLVFVLLRKLRRSRQLLSIASGRNLATREQSPAPLVTSSYPSYVENRQSFDPLTLVQKGPTGLDAPPGLLSPHLPSSPESTGDLSFDRTYLNTRQEMTHSPHPYSSAY